MKRPASPFGSARVQGELSNQLARLAEEVGALRAELTDRTHTITRLLDDAARHQALLNDPRADRIIALQLWLDNNPVPEDALISVVMPTYNRADRVLEAIDAVLRQNYANWELLVADDGSVDDTVAVIEGVDDPRVRLIRADHGGPGHARNAGLAQATGSIIAFSDDDDRMAPGWLRTVAWALTAHPEVDVVYGGVVIESDHTLLGPHALRLPVIDLRPYDRALLERMNFIYVQATAHRAGLPEARFDEELIGAEDYDRILRLTREKPPLSVPAVGAIYRYLHPGSLSTLVDLGAASRQVRERQGLR